MYGDALFGISDETDGLSVGEATVLEAVQVGKVVWL